MLTIALQTLRQRWALFAGAFVALALGVGLMASTATVLIASARPPRPPAHAQGRYAATAVLVRADQQVRAVDSSGAGGQPVAAPRTLPVEVARQLTGVPGAGQVIVDRSFYAQLATAAGPVPTGGETTAGHGWSSAMLTPTGSAPAARPPGRARPWPAPRWQAAPASAWATRSGCSPPAAPFGPAWSGWRRHLRPPRTWRRCSSTT
jgi:putative ABC transport system permease protein